MLSTGLHLTSESTLGAADPRRRGGVDEIEIQSDVDRRDLEPREPRSQALAQPRAHRLELAARDALRCLPRNSISPRW